MIDTTAALSNAEQAQLKLAIKGRVIGALPFLAHYEAVGQLTAILPGLGALVLFIGLGLLHYWLIATGLEVNWQRFAFAAIDACIVCAFASFAHVSGAGDVPQIFMFRVHTVAYLLLFLAISTLSLSPSLVLWTGGSQVVGLWVAFAWIVSGMERTVSWADLPSQPSQQDFLALFSDPDFIGTESRITESMIIVVSAAILALAVKRARSLVQTEARALAARENLARYVSPNLVERLATADDPFGAVRRQHATILFVDIVGFTRFAEQNEPELVITFLRDFHNRMAQAAFDHEGTLDDFIGDEVMAVFGTPEPRDDDAIRALRCAHAMRGIIASWNQERAVLGMPAVAVGIGLHVGTIVAGSTGSADRMKFAVVGDTVSVASRLKAATCELNGDMVVSEAAMRAAGAEPPGESLREISLRGHAAPVAIVLFQRQTCGIKLWRSDRDFQLAVLCNCEGGSRFSKASDMDSPRLPSNSCNCVLGQTSADRCISNYSFNASESVQINMTQDHRSIAATFELFRKWRPSLAGLFLGLLVFGGCHASERSTPDARVVAVGEAAATPVIRKDSRMWMTVRNRRFAATLADTEAARAFAARMPMTLDMTDLNGNEKKIDFSEALPASPSRPGKIRSGDLMLYGTNTLVIFYLTFDSPYSYTRLGWVDDTTGLAQALGNGSVRVAFTPQ
jgi:adenylate cyclase